MKVKRLAAMIMNAVRGNLKVAGIKAPYYGEERRQLLEDLALSVGATFITRESGIKLDSVEMKHFGSAKFIESGKHQTTIVGGASHSAEIDKSIDSLKSKIEQTDDIQECDSHQKRIARLASGVAVIRVGGSTEVEMTERKHRIEDALEAVKSAQEEGIVPGGGTALLHAAASIAMVTHSSDEALGGVIVRAAADAPLRQMALNAGESPDLVIQAVKAADTNYGWDFRDGKIKSMLDNGIIDPVKVTRTALQNAASCAGTLITTNYGIIQMEKQ